MLLIRIAIIFLLSGIWAQTAWGRQWSEFQSDNFTIYSDRKPSQARAILAEFERYHNVAERIMGLSESTRPDPARIYLFADQKAYQALEPDGQVMGFYQETVTGPRMVVSAGSSLADVSLILFHEYVHHLLRRKHADRMPLWYDEGWADFLANVDIDKDSVLVGKVHPWRITELSERMLPVAELLRPRLESTDPEYWAAYYASSWLLMHYLNLGYLAGEDKHTGSLERYLRAWQNGKDPVVAFEFAFNLKTSVMDQQLQRYIAKHSWTGFRIKSDLYEGAIRQRRLPRNEVAYLLGDLAYQAGQPALARDYLRKVEADEASVARAMALRAVIESQDGQIPLANHYIRFALENRSDDPFVLTSAAHISWNNLVRLRNADPISARNIAERVRDLARQALARDRRNTEALRYLWRAERQLGNRREALETMLMAYRTRPTDLRINFEVGSYFAASDEPQRAGPYLRRVINWDHSIARRQQALVLLNSLNHPPAPVIEPVTGIEQQANLFP